MEPLEAGIRNELNFRELGGIRVKDGRTVRRGLLIRSGGLHLFTEEELAGKSAEDVIGQIEEKAWNAYDQKIDPVREQIKSFERNMSLEVIDRAWVDHIDMMSKLRDGIGLRSYAQDNPLQAYVTEGFQMFENMMHNIAQDIVAYCMKVRVVVNNEQPKQA
jgi:preprotein translocase subunit SecA